MVPAFSTFNIVGGGFIFGLIILAIYYTNTWNTGYINIVSNRVFDHHGKLYKVANALDDKGMYDHDKYMQYSAAYLGAANTIVYGAFFAVYAAAITYVLLFHRHEVANGFRSFWASVRRSASRKEKVEDAEYQDVHNRLMSSYEEGELLPGSRATISVFGSPKCYIDKSRS